MPRAGEVLGEGAASSLPTS